MKLSITERFLAKIKVVPTGCWEWQASMDGEEQYGLFWDGSRLTVAHRASYALFCGEIPEGMQVCHSCDNTRCARPRHLFLGTQLDNEADKRSKGRQSKGEHRSLAKLTDAIVLEVRKVLPGSPRGTLQKLAQEYNVSHCALSLAARHKTWRHL